MKILPVSTLFKDTDWLMCLWQLPPCQSDGAEPRRGGVLKVYGALRRRKVEEEDERKQEQGDGSDEGVSGLRGDVFWNSEPKSVLVHSSYRNNVSHAE